MATAKLATVQHATASKEHSLHDVRLLISEHLDIDARFVASETHFIYDLGADFLDRIELMIAIEDRFDVEITDDDIEQFQVDGDLSLTLHANKCHRRRQAGAVTLPEAELSFYFAARARRHDPSVAGLSGSRRRRPCSPPSTDRAVGPAAGRGG
jgi:acyl carrier protein